VCAGWAEKDLGTNRSEVYREVTTNEGQAMEHRQDSQAVLPGATWPGATGPMRVGTLEREQTVDALTAHATAGRLDPEEFDARISAALTARTVDDLRPLLADLPALTRHSATSGKPTRHRGRRLRVLPGSLQPWLATSLVTIVVWAASGGGYFWPIWVIGPWGIIALMSLVGQRHGSGAECHEIGSPNGQRDRRRSAATGDSPSGPFS
jgi:hypothetical protein